MERKVAQTELDAEEYRALVRIAEKKGLTIKEALRETALRWTYEESSIDPKDPIFDTCARSAQGSGLGKGYRKGFERKLTRFCMASSRGSSCSTRDQLWPIATRDSDHLTVLDWARRAVTGDSELCPWMRGPSGRRVGRVTREVDLVGERSA